MSGIAQEEHQKVWNVHYRGLVTVGALVRARTGREAIALLPDSVSEAQHCDRADLVADRVPWLDGFPDLFGPDAMMAKLRHGWRVSLGNEDKAVWLDDMPQSECVDGLSITLTAGNMGWTVEKVFEGAARKIGATYPDKYSPIGFKEEA